MLSDASGSIRGIGEFVTAPVVYWAITLRQLSFTPLSELTYFEERDIHNIHLNSVNAIRFIADRDGLVDCTAHSAVRQFLLGDTATAWTKEPEIGFGKDTVKHHGGNR
jgi:hypothetical protein